MRWRTMGRTFRTMSSPLSTHTLMPRHVHNKDPLDIEIRSRRSFAGASREVPFKLKLMFPLSESDPESIGAACCLSEHETRG
jgi:hypothetical protein